MSEWLVQFTSEKWLTYLPLALIPFSQWRIQVTRRPLRLFLAVQFRGFLLRALVTRLRRVPPS